jgi:cytoplasmic iron level regulating protein YaaA (DUF328/UPF0246 family)
MKILFSPSETKIKGGDFKSSKYLFNNILKDKQRFILDMYKSYLLSASDNELSKLFGLKRPHDIDFFKTIDIYNSQKLKAIQRYTGIAYDYLDYASLEDDAKTFIDKNMIIFSNLYGPIDAGYLISNYKLKQGEKLNSFEIEKYYKEHFQSELDFMLKDEFVIDLRAEFYHKFYTPKKSITMKFIKNGKVVSHWAKAYRGKISRELSKHQPTNEQDFQNLIFENLEIKEIRKTKKSNEYIFDII